MAFLCLLECFLHTIHKHQTFLDNAPKTDYLYDCHPCMTCISTLLIITTNLTVQFTGFLLQILIQIFFLKCQKIAIILQGQLDQSHCSPPQAPIHSDVSLPAGDSPLWHRSGFFQVTQPPPLNCKLLVKERRQR